MGSSQYRILLLGAASAGDLRIGREQKRIRAAVESALHSDSIDLDHRPAATTGDLLDGITRFRPHIVHFTGHSDDKLIEFEKDVDKQHHGVVITAIAYAAQFYAAVANGQSIRSAHPSAQAALELAGLSSSELPVLAHAPDVDPATAILVKPMNANEYRVG
ncbi:hypothetical protein [Actinoplanes couchii]|uniref:Uncharacterized protein n=1 Tax=Actinoplanes couchii TaxID=403638 RepID=A0ABQ3XKH4_9ACTN|nr:hypothetical protein [Actinoplanes couchii]MDR6320600.1 hypothetical protein [Actinoplanes couchii]GID59003.1 hypothetical protein Aco03nite_074070 [Actinoplanes couchii]